MSETLLYSIVVVVPCAATLAVMACLRYVPERWRHVDVDVETPLVGIELSAKEGESGDSE